MPEPWCAPFKVLPLALLIATIIGAQRHTAGDRLEWMLPVVALGLSGIGDLFGDLKFGSFSDTAFLLQIFFFMGAHFVYIATFMRGCWRERPEALPRSQRIFRWIAITALVAFLAIYGSFILPRIGNMAFRYAGCAYMVVISVMFLSAVLQTRRDIAPTVAGAALFVASDALLAYTSFVPGHGISLIAEDISVMGTYYAAQLLLNLSSCGRKD